MSQSVFDAFAIPAAVAHPPGPLRSYEERGVSVRFLDASPAWIGELAVALRGARERLAARAASDVAASLGRSGERFLDPADPLRAEALALLPATSGLSPGMSGAVLDGMAADWTGERLMGLLESELGGPAALDGFHPLGGRDSMAIGPGLAVQVVAGSVPGVGVNALLRSLLLKGPTLLKPGRGDVVLPVLFARALRDVDPELAGALAVVYWPGGSRALEDAALARADVVTAYGSDKAVDDVRSRSPITARFVPYRHRVSVGVVGREALTGVEAEATAAAVAGSVGFFDQRGCVSPQVVYVEEGGEHSPQGFAKLLGAALERLEERLPGGDLDVAEAAALQQTRGTAELMAASGSVQVVHGGSASWTVVFEADLAPIASSAGRLVRVRPLPDVEELPRLLDPLGAHLQTVGVAGLGRRLEGAACALGLIGASRVVPFSSVAFPPPWWHHDGGGPLLDLVRWVDLERG